MLLYTKNNLCSSKHRREKRLLTGCQFGICSMKRAGWVYKVLPLFLTAETFLQWPFCRTLTSGNHFSNPSTEHYHMTLLQPIFFRKPGALLQWKRDITLGERTQLAPWDLNVELTSHCRSSPGAPVRLERAMRSFLSNQDWWNMDGYALMPQRSLAMLCGSLTWRMWVALMVSQEKLPSILWYIAQRLQHTELLRRTTSSSWPPGIATYLKPTFKESYYTGVRADQIRL